MRWAQWRRLLIVAAMVPCLGAAMLAQTSIYVLGRGGIFTTAVFYPDGTASAPSISFATETNKGFYSNAASQIAVSIGGVVRHTWSAGGFNILSDTGTLTYGASSDTALTRSAAGKITLTGTTPMLQLGGTSSSFPALKQSSTTTQFRLADDSASAPILASQATFNGGGVLLNSNAVLISTTAPSSPASCGTSPAVTSNNGTASWVVTGGTGGTATGCTITMPAATTGWNCSITNITAAAAHRANVWTVQTASTTTSVTWEYQTVSTGAATAFTASDVFRGVCFAY